MKYVLKEETVFSKRGEYAGEVTAITVQPGEYLIETDTVLDFVVRFPGVCTYTSWTNCHGCKESRPMYPTTYVQRLYSFEVDTLIARGIVID